MMIVCRAMPRWSAKRREFGGSAACSLWSEPPDGGVVCLNKGFPFLSVRETPLWETPLWETPLWETPLWETPFQAREV